ncbi:MAG: PIN domain-containing protein [Chloroflexi bacterium]|nr:PIN domain-containing protein [Chloroflexota bacterium]
MFAGRPFKQRGGALRLLSLIPNAAFQICLSMSLYLEYQDVLARPEHRLPSITDEQTTGVVRYLASQAHLQEIYFLWRPYLPDSNDDMVLELAVAASASRIITFNGKDFRAIDVFGIKAINPRDFLVEIGEVQ